MHSTIVAVTQASAAYDLAQAECFRLDVGVGVENALAYLAAVKVFTIATREYSRTIVELLSARRSLDRYSVR